MEKTNEKFFEEAAKAQTVEELMKLAQCHGAEVTEEEARLFLSLGERGGEALPDEALDDVSGGGLHYRGHLIVSALYKCDRYNRRRSVAVGAQPNCERCTHSDFSGLFMVCMIN